MSWLIDFIVSNLWLFILIYAGISSVLKSGKKRKEATNTDEKPVFSTPKQSPVWEAERRPRATVPESPEPIRSQIYSAKDIMDPSPGERIRQREGNKEEADNKGRAPARRSIDHTGFGTPAQGMIWSQVFGPPRSKKPHRTVKK